MQERGSLIRYMDEHGFAPHEENGGQGDIGAYAGELYEKYANDVLRLSYFYLGDREKAEDVTQDVFVRLMTRAPSIQAGSEKAWLMKVAVNRCRDIWRGAWLKRVTLGTPAFELIPAPDATDDALDKAIVMDAVHALPAIFKEPVLLHYYQGFGIAEIAEQFR